jgi:lactate dehydrogenase-like 2-hydroxyacid dehydrogenase
MNPGGNEVPGRIVVARKYPPNVVARAKAEFDALVFDKAIPMPELFQACRDHKAEAFLFSGGNNQFLDATNIAEVPPSVKIAATISVGFDHIDVAACRAKGLIVTNTPEILTGCTADTAFTLLLCAARRFGEYFRVMHEQGGWKAMGGAPLGTRVHGKRLGILGFGRIGQAVADRGRGFGMRILYHDVARKIPEQERGAEYFASFEEMLPHCDFLSLHADFNPRTAKIINARTLALLPKGAVFVNAARGGLVDEDALYAALTSGHLAAAGLDVFQQEPEFDTRFASLPNVFITPHAGSATHETRDAMGFRALDNVAAVLGGRAPIDPLWR